MADESTATVTEEEVEVAEEELVTDAEQGGTDVSGKPIDVVVEDEEIIPAPWEADDGSADAPDVEDEPVKAHREYRLELFEEGDNRTQARQRGLAREGWEFPAIHGFVRNLTMGRGTDRFFIVVASRDTEVPG